MTDNSTIYVDADPTKHCDKPNECRNSLSIQNITTQQLSMNYKIILNSYSIYQNQITIAAGATVEIGQIKDKCIYLGGTAYSAESNNITYF